MCRGYPIFEILVIEAIKRRCFKDAQAVVMSRIFEGYFWSKHHYHTRIAEDKDLPKSFRWLEGLRWNRYLVEHLTFTSFFLMEGRPPFVSLRSFEPILVCPRLWQGASAIRVVIRIESHNGTLDCSARTPDLNPVLVRFLLLLLQDNICKIKTICIYMHIYAMYAK